MPTSDWQMLGPNIIIIATQIESSTQHKETQGGKGRTVLSQLIKNT